MERALYREYRPQTFDDVVGQDHVSRTLKNAIQTGSVAHAYIFAGPRGTGKTSLAKILAKALNCTGPGADGRPVTAPTVTPCGTCASCVSIAAGTALDVIEMDAASNRGIDDIRELREKVAFAPVLGRSKVYIVDEAHMLTKEAFNALLKTLEEPPPHVVFVLCTTEVHKIIPTILSRCQRFDLRKPRVQEIARLLAGIAAEEKIAIDEPALIEIARHSEGGFRDAIGTLEKLATFFAGEEVTSREVLDLLGVIETDLLFEIVDIVIDRDPAAALLYVQRVAERGVSYPQFITDLLRHLRQIFLLQHLEEVSEDAVALRALAQNLEIDEQLLDRLVSQANQLAPRELLHFVDLLGRAQTEIRAGLDARLQLELALVRIARPALDHSDEALEERLRRLEAGSVPVPATRAPRAVQSSGPPAATRQAKKPAAAVTTAAADTAVPTPAEPATPEPATATQAPATGADEALHESDSPVPDTRRDAPTAGDALVTGDATVTGDTPATGDAPAPRAQRAWDLVLEQLRRQDDTLYAFLRDARPRAASDTVLVVPIGSNLGLGKLSEPSARALVAAIIDKTVGGAPELKFVHEDERSTPASSGSTAKSASPGAPESDATGAAKDEAQKPATPVDIGLSTAQALRAFETELGAVEMRDDE